MFNNKFQITSLVTVVFSALSMALLSFIFFVIDLQASREYGNNEDDIVWGIIIGLFSVFFLITLGLFFRVDLTRKFIQLMTVVSSFGFAGFLFYRSAQFGFNPRNFLEMLPLLGIGICFLAFMVAVFVLFESRVVKEEFGWKEEH